MYTELKEVLMPFSAKEVEYFNEATKDCTDEARLAVAKRMAEVEGLEGWRLTEAQVRRFVAQESLSKVNWYPTIKINGAGDSATNADVKIKEFKERQYEAYRAGGMSEAEARAVAGL